MQDERERLDALAQLWTQERQGTRARFRAERRQLSLRERLKRGLALARIEVLDAEPAPGGLTLTWLRPAKGDLANLRLGVGDPVMLWNDATGETGGVRATLARRQRDRVAVMIRGDLPPALRDERFRLDREAPEETFDRGDRALRAFTGAGTKSPIAALRSTLFGDAAATFGEVPDWTPLDLDLNPPQREAVGRALAAETLSLLHGPPGTGKTRTLVEIVRQAVAAGQRVLCTAASNLAVDELAERIARHGVALIRLGHPARVSPSLEGHLLHTVVRADPSAALAREWLSDAHHQRKQLLKQLARGAVPRGERRAAWAPIDALFRDAREQLERTRKQVVARTPVICATAAGADADLLGDDTFDLVVVDEATQSPDPMTLVPLTRGRRAVLAGDPCQLPPTVIDAAAERGGLGVTLFERLAAGPQAAELVRLLEVQHRMHRTIMSYPSQAHYGGRLVAAPEVAEHTLAGLGAREDPLRPDPLVWVDTAGKGWEEARDADDPSTHNPGQAERTAAEVRRLLSRGLSPTQVSLITPYDAQVRRLRELLSEERDAGLEIRTVDGFQGRENEAVVVDLVRSNDGGKIGFLSDVRRTNVAITRARRFLLIVGDTATVSRHAYYGGLLAAVEEAGGYVSAWSDEAEPLG